MVRLSLVPEFNILEGNIMLRLLIDNSNVIKYTIDFTESKFKITLT